MTDQQVKRYTLCYRCGGTDYKRRSDCNHPGSSQLMVLEADFSRTDAELRKERTARAEAARAAWAEAWAEAAKAAKLDGEANELAQLEDDKRVLAERVAELDKGRIEGNAQINRLWDRIASLESDLSAVTASSVEHAKTIDGLRADLARAREALRNLANKASGLRAFEGELRATCGNTNFSLLMDAVAAADAAIDSARSATHSEGKEP